MSNGYLGCSYLKYQSPPVLSCHTRILLSSPKSCAVVVMKISVPLHWNALPLVLFNCSASSFPASPKGKVDYIVVAKSISVGDHIRDAVHLYLNICIYIHLYSLYFQTCRLCELNFDSKFTSILFSRRYKKSIPWTYKKWETSIKQPAYPGYRYQCTDLIPWKWLSGNLNDIKTPCPGYVCRRNSNTYQLTLCKRSTKSQNSTVFLYEL